MTDKPTLHDVAARAERAAELVTPLLRCAEMTGQDKSDLRLAEAHLSFALHAIRTVRSTIDAAEVAL